MAGVNALGEFLRARRELLDPDRFALPPDTVARRVPGLRRDEVAFLSGISTHYYARLEQGRDQHPSDAVLEAVAGVLGLDDVAVDLLRRLARATPSRRRPRATAEVMSPRLARLMSSMPCHPAVVVERYRDVLAANALAQLVNPGFAPGRNLLRDTFLDPAAHATYLDWDDIAAGAVAGVRASAGDDPDDPRLRDLVGELSVKSEQFRRLWARHDVRERSNGQKRYETAAAGAVTLQYETFAVVGSPGQTLFVFHAEPDSKDEQALRLLASLVPDATDRQRKHDRLEPFTLN